MARKPGEAQASLEELKRRPSLSEDDRRLLENIALILREFQATR